MVDTGVNGTSILMKIGTKLLAGQISASIDEAIDIIETTSKLSASRAKTHIGGEYGATLSVECSVDPTDVANADYWETRTTMIAREKVAFTLGGVNAGDKYLTGYLIISRLSPSYPQNDRVTFSLDATIVGLPTQGTVTT